MWTDYGSRHESFISLFHHLRDYSLHDFDCGWAGDGRDGRGPGGVGRGEGGGGGGAKEGRGGRREKCMFFLELLHVLISFQLVLIMFHRIFSAFVHRFFDPWSFPVDFSSFRLGCFVLSSFSHHVSWAVSVVPPFGHHSRQGASFDFSPKPRP